MTEKEYFDLINKADELGGKLVLIKTRRGTQVSIYIKNKNKKNVKRK